MKKTIKFIPLMMAPALVLMACANSNSTSKVDNGVVDNDITTYTVTVDFNGGKLGEDTTKDYTVRDGTFYKYFVTKLPKNSEITYEYHTLKGYSLTYNGEVIGDNYQFTENQTIYAVYNSDVPAITCDVTWKNHGGTQLGEVEQYHPGEVPSYKGEEPTIDDPTPGITYKFKGWTPEITPIGESETTPRTYTAQYDEVTSSYAVNFDSQGGSFVKSQVVDKGAKVTKPNPDPTKTGYDFDGWHKEAEAESPWNFEEDTVTGTTTLYAHWENGSNLHTITFHLLNAEPEVTFTREARNGSCLAAPAVPTREGYQFDGWFTAQTGGSQFDFSTVFKADTLPGNALYAHWTHVAKVTVNFDSQGGTTVAAQTIEKGTTATKPNPDPQKVGYDFGGWYDAAEGGTEWVFTNTIDANKTLYAHWEDGSNVRTITFHPQDVEPEVAFTKTVRIGECLVAPAVPTRDGYRFDGWFDASTGGNLFDFSTEFKSSTLPNSALYAHWTAYYTVSFDTKGGTFVPSVQVVAGGTVAEPDPMPTYEGHTISAWFYKKPGQTDPEQFVFDDTEVNSDMTVYCTWTTDSYKVRFIPNGGIWTKEGATSTDPLDLQSKFGTLPDPYSEGARTLTNGKNVFTGWKRTSDGGIGILPIDVPDEGATFCEIYTAQWERGGDTYYTVTFDTDGGSTVIPQNVKENDKAIKPADPTKAGSTFKNWYLEDPATAFNFDTAITEAITLHANWEDAKYTVTWYDEDGTTELDKQDDYAYNDSLVLPVASKTPTKFVGNDRYFFKKWSPNASTSMRVTENMNFYAVYERDNEIQFNFSSTTYTIEGELSFSATYNYGGVIGLTFDGPTFPTTITLEADGATIPTSDYTYNATTGELSLATLNHDWRVIYLTA